jgi:hypothetical protein
VTPFPYSAFAKREAGQRPDRLWTGACRADLLKMIGLEPFEPWMFSVYCSIIPDS